MSKLHMVGAVQVCRVHALGEDGHGKAMLEVACQSRGVLMPLRECLSCPRYLEMRTSGGALSVACDPDQHLAV